MSDGILFHVPQIIRTYNVSRSITATTKIYSTSFTSQSTISNRTHPDISLIACLGFAVLILSTVIGNTLVLLALFLDKRLHSPSFFLIANMAIADLLLGMSVLPFSSILEILNDDWIFGQTFCSTWLALDVLCCTASIIALMAVSIDRYLGVTRPLTYSSIMTMRRTIYLIFIVWAVSILTSVVPLFGLTDRGKKSKDISIIYENSHKCEVNKNTFYTIFSSMISFYIPVIILLILYSRIYQVAKKQGKKLEDEKRRLYEIDYLKATELIRKQQEQEQQQNHSNGHSRKTSLPSDQDDNHNKNDFSSIPLMHDGESSLDRSVTSTDGIPLKKIHSNYKIKNDDDNISHSGSSMSRFKKRTSRLIGKRLYSTIQRSSTFYHNSHSHQYNHQISANEELILIKRKLHNLRREKKAFRTVGIILGVLLICWLPFFVTLPVMSILKHHGFIKDEKTENTWFKITFWLGYCNSALNPFVYAFSNRAIRQAFRQVLFRRCFWCGFCRKKPLLERQSSRRQRTNSTSFITDTSQIVTKRNNSFSTDCIRKIPKAENDLKTSSDTLNQGQTTIPGPAVSFNDFLAETADEDNHDDDEVNERSNTESTKKDSNPT